MKANLPKLYTQVGNTTPIGNSNINAIGCLTVDAAMAATYFGHAIDPSTLAKSVTYQGNLWVWGELTRLFPDIVYKGQVQTPALLTDAQMNQIKGLIDKGYPVFLQIQTPIIPEHWMLAVDYNGDDFLCADPLKNPPVIHAITDYEISPRTVIYAYAWYEGKLPVQGDALAECLRQHTVLVTEIDNLKRENKTLTEYKNTHPFTQADLDKAKKDGRASFKTDLINHLNTMS